MSKKEKDAVMEAENSIKTETTQAEPDHWITDPGPVPDNEEDTKPMFSKYQVSAIIRERVARERRLSEARLAELENKLAANERRSECQAFLREKGYPSELLEQIDTGDVEAFKGKAEKLNDIFSAHLYPAPKVRDAGEVLKPLKSGEALRSAFSNSEHVPKQYEDW